ncbi:hypothetical protein QE368_002944 [Asaia bogorensis NBRC 16594]|nr:hypothetical protein [Asaia bogorensis NBRC 16594]
MITVRHPDELVHMVKHDITIGGHFSFGNCSDHAFRRWGRIGVTEPIKLRTDAAFRLGRETAVDIGTFVLDDTVITATNGADSACLRSGDCLVLSAGADIILGTWAAKGDPAVLFSFRLMSEEEGCMSDVGLRHVKSRSWQHTALRASRFLVDDPEETKAGQRGDSLALTIRPPVLPLAAHERTSTIPTYTYQYTCAFDITDRAQILGHESDLGSSKAITGYTT